MSPKGDPSHELRKPRTYGELIGRGPISLTIGSTIADGLYTGDSTAYLCPLTIPLGAILSIEEL